MSRIRTFGASLIVLALGTGVAAAADISQAPPVAPEPSDAAASVFTWTGGYVGGELGYGWGSATTGGASFSADGIGGGLYTGYNFQPGSNFVLGIEGDITAHDMSGSAGGISVSNPWNATLRGRAGFAFDRFLIYGTGGVAFGDVKVTNGGLADSQWRTGWTAGGGVEAAITNSLIGRVEYRYTDLGTATYATAPATSVGFTSNQVLVGVGVKF
jgi:outer membrane immunogenic protein